MKHRRKQNKHNPHSLDRAKAYQLYITPNEDGTLRTVANVAEELGFNTKYLHKVASDEGWVRKRTEVGRLAMRQIELTAIENQAKVNKDLYDVWLLSLAFARQMAIKNLSGDEFAKAMGVRSFRDFTEGMKNVTDKMRVLSGQPSDISKSNIDATLNSADSITEEDVQAFNRFLGKKTDSVEAVKKPDVAPTQ